jgi:3-oxoadipate enol-lactonase
MRETGAAAAALFTALTLDAQPPRQGHGSRRGPEQARHDAAGVRRTAMPTALGHGVELYCERAGSGPRLLFCNGSGTTIASTRGLLHRLAEHFELVCFDYRGMGLSAPLQQPYRMADVAADVLALLDQLGWQQAPICGWSFGGMVAQELAVTAPERLERLALLSTSPGGAFASFRLDTLADLPPQQRHHRALQLMDHRWTPEWLAQHPADAELAGLCGAQAPAHQPDTQAQGRLWQLQARKDHNVLDRLGRIACPTWVANGRYDGIAPPANGQAIAERVAGAHHQTYDGGHAFFLQDPVAWRELVTFLSGQPG